MTFTRKLMTTIAAVTMTASAASAQSTTTYVPPGPCPHNPEWVKSAFWMMPSGGPCIRESR